MFSWQTASAGTRWEPKVSPKAIISNLPIDTAVTTEMATAHDYLQKHV